MNAVYLNKNTNKRSTFKIVRMSNIAAPQALLNKDAGPATTIESHIVTPSNAADWRFTLKVHRMVGIIGLVREESHQFEWLVKMSQDGEELKGVIANGGGEHGESVCAEATLAGRINNDAVSFVVTYEGICCHLAQMKFTGRLSNDGKSMTGSLEPVGLPNKPGCSLIYATVTASRHKRRSWNARSIVSFCHQDPPHCACSGRYRQRVLDCFLGGNQ
jgi:hypothetical protein